MMRRATGRPVIIGFHGSYHGESTTTAALGAEAAEISSGLRALVPGFAHVPYPHAYRSPFKEPRPGGSGDSTVDYIRDHLLFHALDPADVAGVVIEPILGSGGCVAPPDSFWPALTELCREHDWLLCADEVKSGMGRSGHLFAVERWGVEPDLMCLGKALGGGVMPIGALLGTERVLGEIDDVPTGSTWAWLPGACAAAIATLDVFAAEPVLENVAALEAVANERLGELRDRHEAIGDVRAEGCFQAIEFVTDRETANLDSALQHAVAAEMVRRGVLADSSSTSLNIQPSLVMPPAVLDERLRHRRRGDRSRARRPLMTLDAQLAAELGQHGRGGHPQVDPRAYLTSGARGRDRGPGRGDLPLLERLPGAGSRSRRRRGRRRGPRALRRRNGLGAVHLRQVRAPRRARATTSPSSSRRPRPSPTSRAGTRTPRSSTRFATCRRRSSPTA